LGLSVAIFDYVEPSPNTGTTWGLGGTCVNVGCIPKKLFHIAASMKHNYEPAQDFGHKVSAEKVEHDWSTLRNNVQNYIKGINFSYKSKLSEFNIDYINAKATFASKSSIKFEYKSNFFSDEFQEYQISGSTFVICTGGRPRSHPVA
jgi:thioredoxin reductase (NADPH)